MRRRSGAFHCESEHDFMQLAEAAHDHIGIFYDERTNRKIMTHLRPAANHIVRAEEVTNPQLSAEKQIRDYRGFEFGLENEAEREELEQLSRANLETTRALNVGIVAADPQKVRRQLAAESREEAGRWLELVTESHNCTSVKYWILSRQHNKREKSMAELYLQRCHIIVEIEDGLKIRRRGSPWEAAVLSQLQLERRLGDA